ncbi:MAG: transporter [Streptosporangiaceae bacterium]|nr:transporter [Streptosporangiaceae bacterium]
MMTFFMAIRRVRLRAVTTGVGLPAALLQRGAPKEALPSVLAANGVIGVLAVPFGTLPGGPLVDLIGARQALLLSAVLTLATGGVAALILAVQPARRRPQPALTDPL